MTSARHDPSVLPTVAVLTRHGVPDGAGWGEVVALPDEYRAGGCEAFGRWLEGTGASWALLWDGRSPLPPSELLTDLAGSRADAVLSKPTRDLATQPPELDYVRPTWTFTLESHPDVAAPGWRASPAALVVKVDALRSAGGLDPGYDTWAGAVLDLGYRLITSGAITIADPRLSSPAGDEPLPSDRDRAMFARRHFAPKWRRYAAVRRAMASGTPTRVLAAYRWAARAATAPAPMQGAHLERPPVAVNRTARVSVVLPTLGRYDLLRPLLEQLRSQTLRAHEVIVVDQNDAAARDHRLYEKFADLGLKVIFQDERGQWRSRNAAVRAATGDWIAFLDDDSSIESDFLERHLEGLARYHAELSTGASLAVVGAPIPESYGYFRVADQFDSGNGMCHRRLFEQVGLFDEQYDRMRRGDAEFGLRVQLAGGLVIHNPHAIRIHLKAAEGGLRTFGSWDGFRSKDRSAPLPLPSVVYYTKTYHSPRQAREDLLLGVVQAIVPYHLKRRATPVQWARFALAEVVHLPTTVARVRRSLALADAMIDEGPRIPALAGDERFDR